MLPLSRTDRKTGSSASRHRGQVRGQPHSVVVTQSRADDPEGSSAFSFVIELTHLSFSAFVASHRFALIHFWAPWNGHDTVMKNILESEVTNEVHGIAFGRLNTDLPEHFELLRKCEVVALPLLGLFRNGKLIEKVVGLASAQTIIQKLSELQYSSLESS